MNQIYAFLNSNPTLVAMSGTMVTGAILYILRAAPTKIWSWAVKFFTVTVHVNGDDAAFDWINEWLSEHKYSARARMLKLTTARKESQGWALAPGFGWHVFWDKGLVVLNRSYNDKVGTTSWQSRPKETLAVITLGRSSSTIRRIINEAHKKTLDSSTLAVHIWHDKYWTKVPQKVLRPLDSVFLPKSQKDDIVDSLNWFFANQSWFTERGVPYRQGVLFFGIPGTGKTTIVSAMASHFSKPIYIINLASVGSDNELLSAFNSTSSACIVLIEDIDAVKVSEIREKEEEILPKEDKKEEISISYGVTLSGLLNAIDGVASSEGRVLAMTTNHIEKLDPALIRPGRIDKRYEIQPLQKEQVVEMAKRFFPENVELVIAAEEKADTLEPRPGAFWQVEFMDKAREMAGKPVIQITNGMN